MRQFITVRAALVMSLLGASAGYLGCRSPGTDASKAKDDELKFVSAGLIDVIFDDGGTVHHRSCSVDSVPPSGTTQPRSVCPASPTEATMARADYETKLKATLSITTSSAVKTQNLIQLQSDLNGLQQAEVQARLAGAATDATYVQEIKTVTDQVTALQTDIAATKTAEATFQQITSGLGAAQNATFFFPGTQYEVALAPFNVTPLLTSGTFQATDAVATFCPQAIVMTIPQTLTVQPLPPSCTGNTPTTLNCNGATCLQPGAPAGGFVLTIISATSYTFTSGTLAVKTFNRQ